MNERCKTCKHVDEYAGRPVCWLATEELFYDEHIYYLDDDSAEYGEICDDYEHE